MAILKLSNSSEAELHPAPPNVSAAKITEPEKLKKREDEEHIIVIGGQNYIHDTSWYSPISRWGAGKNGKFMFIHQAMRKIFLNPDLNWNILIFKYKYTDKQINIMKQTIDARVGTCKYTIIDSHNEFYNYINTKDANNSSDNVTIERSSCRIKRMHFYCHGIVFRLAIGITNRSPWDIFRDITISNVHRLNKDAFYADARIYCFSCRTGLGNDKIDESVYYKEIEYINVSNSKEPNGYYKLGQEVTKQYSLYSAQSLAQKFADITGAVVYAYLRRSDYSDTLNTADELDFKDAYEAGQNGRERERKNSSYDYLLDKSKATENDKNRYDLLHAEEQRRIKVDGAIFDLQGAKYPVRAAETPTGLPMDMKTFQKMR